MPSWVESQLGCASDTRERSGHSEYLPDQSAQDLALGLFEFGIGRGRITFAVIEVGSSGFSSTGVSRPRVG